MFQQLICSLYPVSKCCRYVGQVSAANAVVLAHSSNDDVQCQVARILYADATANGRLSASISDLFAAGDGRTITPKTPRHFVPDEHGMNSRLLTRIDEIAREGIKEGAYPGCQIVILKDGKEMYNKAFGTHTWPGVMGTSAKKLSTTNIPGAALPVSPTDVYDLASLTKTTATLLAVMKLYDKGRLNLTDRVSDYRPGCKIRIKKISRFANCCCMNPDYLLHCCSIRKPLIKKAMQELFSKQDRMLHILCR